jgi:hypothetical protein
MNWFHSILAKIYCQLVVAGLNISPPAWLFHRPKKQLKCRYHGVILADKNFTDKEQQLILQAKHELEMFCNGSILLTISFDLDPTNQEVINNCNTLLRVNGNHPDIILYDPNFKNNIFGLCCCITASIRTLYLVTERLTTANTFKTTAIHELGHFIGLNHTKSPSIMHEYNYDQIIFLTYIDALEMSRAWQCPVQDLCYFKRNKTYGR